MNKLRKILVVDDAETNRSILKKILSNDYDVIEAEDGKTALEILNADCDGVSAVLLDIIMPEMDGYEVLRRIRENPSTAAIPVIVATGNTDAGSEVKALSLGANDYVTKPYNRAVIVHRLYNTINLRETAAIANLAKHDDLTGSFNRNGFFEAAAAMIAEKEPGYYVLSCIDINNFKVINDQYGSRKGDIVLRLVADIQSRAMTRIGGISSRIMADVFAVLYPKKYIDSDEIREIWRQAALLDGSILPISFSAGRYVVDDPTVPVNIMFDRASIAKASVKGRYDTHIANYDESMRNSILREQKIVTEMNRALEERQFEVWFQPQYNHATGAMIGAEALVRWRNPETEKLIPPNDFIPVFERNGFIYKLDQYVWEQVCICLREWMDAGIEPLPVSVNISRCDILFNDIVDVICNLRDKYSLPLDLLRLEITESAFATASERITAVVKTLIDNGFTVEIDDFGTGYSSLNTLKDVPATILKLDMRFLENTGDSERGGNILESIIRMSRWLGMSVIAEGVETIEQADYLLSIGCNYVQGYLYSKPIPLESYEALFEGGVYENKMLALETVETLDNNAFWDPRSMDTLIFNSYVGGACIFEYNNEKVEILRVNAKYAQELSDGKITTAQALSFMPLDCLDVEDYDKYLSSVKKAIETGEEIPCEICMRGLPGEKKTRYLRLAFREIARAGSRRLIYCSILDLTAQREAEIKERTLSEQLRSIMGSVSSGITAITISDDGAIKFIFSNDRFYSIHGYTREQYITELQSPFDIVYPEDIDRIKASISEIMQSGVSASYSYRCTKRTGEIVWLRCNASVMTMPGIEEKMLLSVTADITREKDDERRLKEASDQILFLNETAHSLLSLPDTDSAINSSLTLIMDYFSGNRAYVIEINNDETASNTYEVCAEGVTSEKEMLQNVPLEICDGWFKALDECGYIAIEDVNALADDSLEKQILLQQNIGSLVAVPLLRNGETIGFIGVDDPRINQSHTSHLQAIGDYLTVMLERRDRSAKLENVVKNTQSLMDDTPGGFLRIKAESDGNYSLAFVNKGLCSLLGTTAEHFTEYCREDVFIGVHPADVIATKKFLDKLIETGEPGNFDFRMINLEHDYIWGSAFGRRTENDAGEVFVNMYYNVVTEAKSRELSVRDTMPIVLRAIMESTNDYAFAKDRELKYICCSLPFARLAGKQSEEEIVGKTDDELFNRELVEAYRNDDLYIIESGNAVVDKIESIPSGDKLQRYSKTSKYPLRDSIGNIIGLYGVGSDVTEYKNNSERLKLLTDSIPGGIASYIVSSTGIRMLYFNDGYCRLIEETRENCEKLYENNVFATVYPDDIKIIQSQIEFILNGGDFVDCTFRIRTRYGIVKWVNLRAVPNGKPTDGRVLVNAVLFDVTKAKSVEQALKLSREQLELRNSLVDDSSSAVYVCDAETKELLYLNKNAAKLAGHTVAEGMGMKCHAFLRGLDKPCDPCYMCFSNDKEYTQNVFVSPASGKQYMLRGKFINWDGRRALVEYMSDETERINAEKGLQRLINGIPGGVGIYAFYPDGRFENIYFNDSFYSLVGADTPESRAFYSALSVNEAVYPDDFSAMMAELLAAEAENRTASCEIRLKMVDGSLKWFNFKVNFVDKTEEKTLLYVSFTDVDKEKNLYLQLKTCEYALDFLSRSSAIMVWLYDIDKKRIKHSFRGNVIAGAPEVIENVPEGLIELGIISEESKKDFLAMFEALKNGAERVECDAYLRNINTGAFEWQHLVYIRLNESYYVGQTAVGIAANIDLQKKTQQRYERERQLRHELIKDSLIYYELNLTTGTLEDYQSVLNDVEGMRPWAVLSDDIDNRILDNIVTEDREAVQNAIFLEPLRAAYNRGEDSVEVSYRRRIHGKGVRWMKATVNIMKRPESGDIVAFLYFKDIDEEHRQILDTRKRAEMDGMTGLLNKVTTESTINSLLSRADPVPCTMLVADLDYLKSINDSEGHKEGDNAIKAFSDALRAQFRRSDIIGRIGGDEFVIFLNGVDDETRLRGIVTNFMRRLSAIRLGEENNIPLRGSIGIAVAKVGEDNYESVFRRADRALYHVKRNGKDSFAFYTSEMDSETYQYINTPDRSKWNASYIGNDDLARFLNAVSKLYPLVISANLTQNSYYMMNYDNFTTKKCSDTGVYDELIETGAVTFREEDREAFIKTFSRQALLDTYARGEKTVSLTGSQLGDDGIYRDIVTTVIFVCSKTGDDIHTVSLSRQADK